MKVEPRYKDGKVRGMILVSESEQESSIIDEVCGKTVDEDGLIARLYGVEVRLSDGYGEHYLSVSKKEPI